MINDVLSRMVWFEQVFLQCFGRVFVKSMNVLGLFCPTCERYTWWGAGGSANGTAATPAVVGAAAGAAFILFLSWTVFKSVGSSGRWAKSLFY